MALDKLSDLERLVKLNRIEIYVTRSNLSSLAARSEIIRSHYWGKLKYTPLSSP